MHILVTNDDGVTAPGLLALANAMKNLGDVTVLAPDRVWSASGHVKTMHRPLRVKHTQLADSTPALAADGAPSDCVALALLGLVPHQIDLVVSGINSTANLGQDVTYSGTVTAAMEAVIWGIPGIAFSLDSPPDGVDELDFAPAAHVAMTVSKRVMANSLPKGTVLNVNVPYLPENDIKGQMITRQGQREYRDELVQREDPRGRPYYWIGGESPTGAADMGTDIGAIRDGYVSITPLHLDLTDYPALEALRTWQWDS